MISNKDYVDDEEKKIINALIQNYFCVKLFLEFAGSTDAALDNITIINLITGDVKMAKKKKKAVKKGKKKTTKKKTTKRKTAKKKSRR
ncbi:MAG: hypothetical protein FJ116_05900 [Deltaproteobacteria bacterium]|nr:hypothetical protein [Deltaproteobacteria bacterium]